MHTISCHLFIETLVKKKKVKSFKVGIFNYPPPPTSKVRMIALKLRLVVVIDVVVVTIATVILGCKNGRET